MDDLEEMTIDVAKMTDIPGFQVLPNPSGEEGGDGGEEPQMPKPTGKKVGKKKQGAKKEKAKKAKGKSKVRGQRFFLLQFFLL